VLGGHARPAHAAAQQNVGAMYIAAAARLFVAGDRRVLPLVDGTGVRAPSADPARVLSHAVGAARTPFVVPDAATTAGGGARMCRDVTGDEAGACVPDALWQPHFVTMQGVSEDPDRFAVALSGAGTIRPAEPVSLAGSDSLALRIIVPPNTTGTRFDVAITDTHGHTARLGTVSLDGLTATANESALWAQEVRVPLRGADLRSVAALSLTSSGQAWLVDAHGWRSGLPAPRPVALPRVDVGAMTVEEGDSGTRRYEIPVSVSGSGTGTVRLFVFDEQGTVATRLVTVHPGQHAIEVPFEVTGNTRWSTGSNQPVLAKAVHGAVSGGYVGGLQVLDDDPPPTVTVTQDAGTVAEGGALTWTVTVSEAADSPLYFFGWPEPVDGPELSSTDVEPRWFVDHAYEEPLPSRPLSQTSLYVDMMVDPGALTASVTVPTVTDDETEPTERVRLYLTSWPQVIEDQHLVGAVGQP
jgi:hypothetical protein